MENRLENKQASLAIENKNVNLTYQAYVTDEETKVRTLKEAYYQWVSRLVMLVCLLSFAFFVSSSLVLFRMAPNVTVEPFLIIKQDNSDSMVRYEVIAQDMASRKQIMETFIKQYVTVRNAIINDEREMQSRWFAGGIVNYLSAPNVFIDFKKSEVSHLNSYLKEGRVRDVEIISISKVGGERSPVWKIDFKTYDITRTSATNGGDALNLTTHYWTASLTAFFIKERMFMAAKLMNPLGFTVVRYSQTEVEVL